MRASLARLLHTTWRPWPTVLLRAHDVALSQHRTRALIMGVMLPVVCIGYGTLISFSEAEDWKVHSLVLLMVFHNAPTAYGLVLVFLGVVLLCGTITDTPAMVWLSSLITGLWFMTAGLATLIVGMQRMDAISVGGSLLWMFFALSCFVNAQIRVGERGR